MSRAVAEEITLDAINKDLISKHQSDLNVVDKTDGSQLKDGDNLETIKQMSMDSIAFNDYKDEIMSNKT